MRSELFISHFVQQTLQIPEIILKYTYCVGQCHRLVNGYYSKASMQIGLYLAKQSADFGWYSSIYMREGDNLKVCSKYRLLKLILNIFIKFCFNGALLTTYLFS